MGLGGRQLPDEEADEGRRGHDGQGQDERRVEPLVPLALVEEELQAEKAHRHQHQPRDVHPHRLAQVRRVEEHGAGDEEADHPDGHVDVEDPAPRPVVGDPAAQGGPEDGGHHDAHPPRGHGHAALPQREDLPHDRLRQRHEGAAADALEHAGEEQHRDVRGEPAQHRGQGEDHRAREEEALAPEGGGQPPRGGEDDRVGGQIGGEDPRHLVDAGRQRSLDVREGHVGDGDVEDLHHRDQHDGAGDRPLPRGPDRSVGAAGRVRRHELGRRRACASLMTIDRSTRLAASPVDPIVRGLAAKRRRVVLDRGRRSVGQRGAAR